MNSKMPKKRYPLLMKADLVLYYKYLLFLKGDADYQHHLNAFDELGPNQKNFAASQLALFERWYRWPEKQYPVE